MKHATKSHSHRWIQTSAMTWTAVSLAVILGGGRGACAAQVQTLVTFNNTNGADPADQLAADALGNLYGTTRTGGTNGLGTLFELSGADHKTLTTLASFTGANGSVPQGRLTFDSAGNLFGTTVIGGPNNSGTVFELSGVNHQILTTLFNFNSTNGYAPCGGVVSDSAGNLYGTTQLGGSANSGTVFELSGANHQNFSTLINFNTILASAYSPNSQLLIDAGGNVFGTTEGGGTYGGGTVFELPGSNHQSIATLASFNAPNGSKPSAGLVADATGNLYGTTQGPDGTVFELSGSNHQTMTTLVAFNGSNGSLPFAGLTFDGNGNLYGTTSAGGTVYVNGSNTQQAGGTIFELSGSNHQTFTSLVNFVNPAGGLTPNGAVTIDSAGNIFGTTSIGGVNNDGTVFEISTTVPEPAGLALAAAGTTALLARRRRRQFAG